jgi:hypothetical protein
MKVYKYYIGIDCGVNTGIAVWSKAEKRLRHLDTVMIHQAMDLVKRLHASNPGEVFARVEDARLAVFGRQNDIHRAQGAGSVKRDARIWEDFLTDINVPFEMTRPRKAVTKLKADAFKKMTGCRTAGSSHARDAAMLVFGL